MSFSSGLQFPNRQRGVALLVVLVMLLIMTLLGLASLRGTLMGQRMSANSYDRNLSFQSAEAGLREAEAKLSPGVATSLFVANCAGGYCAQPTEAANTPDRWLNTATTWQNATSFTTATTAPQQYTDQPQYIIEYMGLAPNWPGCDQEIPINPNCLTPRYRVTARNGVPSADRAQVVLQSNYAAAVPAIN